MAIPYRSRAPAPAAAIAGVLAAALVAGLAAAAAAVAVGLWQALPLLGAAGLGLGAGAATGWAAIKLRLSRRLVVGSLAAAGGLAGWVLWQGADLAAERAERAANERHRARDFGMAGLPTPAATPPGWFDYVAARYGLVPATPPVHGSATGSVGRAGALAFGVVELLLCCGVAAGWAAGAAGEPACPRCGRWRTRAPLGRSAEGTLGAIEAALRGAGPLGDAVTPPDTREEIRVFGYQCPAGHDGGGGVARFLEWRVGRRGRLRPARSRDWELGEDELAALEAALGAEEST